MPSSGSRDGGRVGVEKEPVHDKGGSPHGHIAGQYLDLLGIPPVCIVGLSGHLNNYGQPGGGVEHGGLHGVLKQEEGGQLGGNRGGDQFIRQHVELHNIPVASWDKILLDFIIFLS